MKTLVIDGGMMTDREAAHDYLALRLALPDHYGRNLDALFDALTERSEPTRLVVYRRREMEAALGDYGGSLLEALRDAARDNPSLQVLCDGEDT